MGIKPDATPKPKPRPAGIKLEDYLRSKIGVIEGIMENLTEVPADAWELLEESDPGLAGRPPAAGRAAQAKGIDASAAVV